MESSDRDGSGPERRLGVLEKQYNELRKQVDAASNRDDTDRSFIARIVVIGFGASVLVIMALMFLGAGLGGGGPWREAMSTAVDLVKSVLLPVVTLILGYYFGRAAKG